MWKPEHRIAADRSGLRYPSDLTGAEWAVVEPMVPPAKAPQRVAIPFPAPYPTGRGVISVEGVANGAVISISPAWHIDSLGGSASLDVVWTPDKPC